MKRYLILILLLLFVFSLSSSVLASGVDGSAVTNSTVEPDTSAPNEATLSNINDNLGIIQGQLWIILIVGLLGYVYKFFRLFF